MILWRGCVAFLLSNLMATLTYVLMDNFCPCFLEFLETTGKSYFSILHLRAITLRGAIEKRSHEHKEEDNGKEEI